MDEADPRRTGRALQILAKKAGIYGMIGGQVVDVKESGHQIGGDVLDFIYRLKTGRADRIVCHDWHSSGGRF